MGDLINMDGMFHSIAFWRGKMFSEYQRDTQRDSDQIYTHTQEHTHIHVNTGNIARWTSQTFGSTTLVSYVFQGKC